MKNYPLLNIDNKKPWIAWNKTYLTEINNNILSLWDYINYFMPDYAEKALKSEEGEIDIKDLDYNEFYRATQEDVKVKDLDIYLQPGWVLISKARNENDKNYKNNKNYYFVQPFGYGSFYIYTYNNEGRLIGVYDRYAEETYGLNYMFSLFSTYPRFILWKEQKYTGQAWTFANYTEDFNIATKNLTLWTDPSQLRPMFFHFLVSGATGGTGDQNSAEYGEEIIVDMSYSNAVNIENTQILFYTETVKGNNGTSGFWPTNIITRVI